MTARAVLRSPGFRKLVFSVFIARILLAALRSVNDAYVRVWAGGGWMAAWPPLAAAAFVGVALVAWFASSRLDATVSAGWLAAALVGVVGVGYAVHLLTTPVYRFGSAVALRPGSFDENYTRRGTHTYHVNSQGFRGPEWSGKQPGTLRGVVIGDSMVFGSGVDAGETIDAALADWFRRMHPGTPIEVLNLGVRGTNLPGYVELYRSALQRLDPDFAVICFFLPNDLGELEQPWEESRAGAYSFFQFLLGSSNNPYTFRTMWASEGRSDESKMGFLMRYVDAMEAVRRSRPAVPLLIFVYSDPNAQWTGAIRDRLGSGAVVIDHGTFPDADFIAGDGHPTPGGNRDFAAVIGGAVERSLHLHPARPADEDGTS